MLDKSEQKKGGFRAFSERQQERDEQREAAGIAPATDAAPGPSAGVAARADKTIRPPTSTDKAPAPR